MGDAIHGTRQATAAVGESVRDVAEQTRDAISDAVEHGKRKAGRYYDRAADKAGELKEMGAEQLSVLRGHVERNAVASTFIAFAAGFLISRFLFRR